MANDKKNAALGINVSTAQAQLKKNIMFKLMQQLELDVCFQCQAKIETVEVLSVEHKEPWLSAPDPKASFFDLNNIAFSHLSCNIGAASHPTRLTDEERSTNRRKREQEYRMTPQFKAHNRDYQRRRYAEEPAFAEYHRSKRQNRNALIAQLESASVS